MPASFWGWCGYPLEGAGWIFWQGLFPKELNRCRVQREVSKKHSPNSLVERRFLDEAQITGQLQHPGIPPVHEVGALVDGRAFLVMKLIKGRKLARILEDGSENRGSLVAVFEQVCQAVAYAHSRGVIHRDLKPANVMVGAFGEVQVIDWGLAKVLPDARADTVEATVESTFHDPRNADEDKDTQPGSFLGTPAYMSPEQAIGAVDQIDERSDVFGLGGILCAILTGKPPFVGNTAESTRQLAAQKRMEPAFVRLDECGAEPELVALCKRCLAGEREARLRNAGEVATAVHGIRTNVEERARRAEQERAAAEAKAAEEVNTRREAEARADAERAKAIAERAKADEQNKRRRVQLFLVADVGLLIVSIGGFVWYQDREAELAKLRKAEFDAEQARVEGERKAEQVRFDTERRLKAQTDRDLVTRLLPLAMLLRSQYRFDEAGTTLKQAHAAAASGATNLVSLVAQAQVDLAFVSELDSIRGNRSTWITMMGEKGRFDKGSAPPAYRKAFASRGLDVTANPEGVGERVAASAVRSELLSALDDWLILEQDKTVRGNVLVVLRKADPNSAADPFRDPSVWTDKTKLERLALAAEADVASLSPGAVVAIAEIMHQARADAAPLLRQALLLHPRDFLIAFELGQILPPRNPESVGAYRTARATRPDHYVTINNLGSRLLEAGDVKGAIVTFNEAISLYSESARCHNNLGTALAENRQIDKAIASFAKAIALDEKNASAHCNLGTALLRKKEYNAAIASFTKAITLNAKHATAHCNLGICRIHKIEYDAAIASFKTAIACDPEHFQAHFNLGNALYYNKDFDAAIASFTKAIDIDPKDSDPHNGLGAALAAKGEDDAAILAYKDAIQLNPNNASAHFNLGTTLLRMKDYRAAIACFTKAAELEPMNPRAHYYQGIALALTGEVDAAIRAFTESINLNPNNSQAQFNLGTALLNKKKYDAAIAPLTKAVALDPNNEGFLINLGIALDAVGKYDEAIICFTKVLDLPLKNARARARAQFNLRNAQAHKQEARIAPPPRELLK